MRLRLKPSVEAALSPEQATVAAEALNQLAEHVLNAQDRWRVRQLEVCLCEKPEERTMDEP